MGWFRSLMDGRSKRGTRRKGLRSQGGRRRAWTIEPLEPRLLLNADLILPTSVGFEPTVAVDPANANSVAASQFNAVWTSANGGATFPTIVAGTNPPTLPGYIPGGDPALAYDSTGRLFWAHLAVLDLNGNGRPDLATEDMSVVVQSLNPGGGAVDVTPGLNVDDKPWLAADANPASPFRDNLYVVWNRLVVNATTGREEASVWFARSTNNGANWSAPVQLNAAGEGYVWPAEVAVGDNGDVWVAWHTNTHESMGAAGGVQMRRSTDGGQNFGAELTPFPGGTADVTVNDAGVLSPSNARIPNLLSWLQGSLQPRILVDPVRPGNIYVVSVDNPVNTYTAGDPSDIVLARSTDNGATWARSTISHAPAGSVQFMPSAAIDEAGNIAVTWYDTRANSRQSIGVDGIAGSTDDSNFLLDVFATFSADGGLTFFPRDFRINDASFDPEPGARDRFPGNNVRRIGEYNGLAAANGIASAVWTGNTFNATAVANGQQPRFDTFALRVVNSIPGLNSQETLGYTSDVGPALVGHNGSLYLAHAGVDEHLYLDVRSAAKPSWGPGPFDGGQLTDQTPTMTSLDNRLFLGWTGLDDHLNVAAVNTGADGSILGLTAQETLGYTSEVGPALASLNGALYLAHAGQDEHLYLDWRRAGAPTSAAKTAWGPGPFNTGQLTDSAPTLFALDERLFLGWKGTDDHLNVAVVDTAADGSIRGLIQQETLGYTSGVGPALTALHGALYLAHAGQDDGLFLDFQSANKRTWGPGAIGTGQETEVSPAMAAVNNRVFLAWTGLDDHLNVAGVGTTLGTVALPLQAFPVVNGVLTVNGDQFGPDYNDQIVIERSGAGGVRVVLNGQVAEFGPGTITGIAVNTLGGTNAVDIAGTFAEAPVTVHGGGTDRLGFLGAPAATPFYTPGAGGSADGRLNVGTMVVDFTGLELVDDVAPRVTGISVTPADIDEQNGQATVSGAFVDPGSFATHTLAMNWGDGVSDPAIALALGARSFTLSHRYLDDNPTGTLFDINTIIATLTDNDPLMGTGTTSIMVRNIAPQLANILATAQIDENGVVSLTGDILDPGTQDTFTLRVDWGEGASETFSYAAGTTQFSVLHQYLDDNPTGTPQDVYTIGLTLTDDDTGQDADGTTTLVRNVAPVITALSTSSPSSSLAREGELISIQGSFGDVGTLDTHTVTVDWADGIVDLAQVAEAGGTGTFLGQHRYQFGGIYPVLVTVRDDDTGEVARTKAVFITGVGVHVVGGLTSLQVVGTNEADDVMIDQQGKGVVKVHTTFLTERTRSVPLAGLDIIQVVVLGGDDRVTVAGNVSLPAVLDGGDGNDQLNGSNAGGVLIGGPGDDQISGGRGRDILIGGAGADRAVGNGGDDILIGGRTAYDSGADDDKLANDLSLLKLLEEWRSSRPYALRVTNIQDGTGPVLSGTGLSLKRGTTVFADVSEDVMTGSAGIDWFFVDLTDDRVTDRQLLELIV